MSDVVHIAGEERRDSRRSRYLNKLHMESLGAEKAAPAGSEQREFLKRNGWKANPNRLLLRRDLLGDKDNNNKIENEKNYPGFHPVFRTQRTPLLLELIQRRGTVKVWS